MKQRFTILMLPLVAALLGTLVPSNAKAQIASSVVVTVGTSSKSYGYDAGAFGSLSQSLTADGHTITALYDNVNCGNLICIVQSYLSVKGFSSDPGKTWLGTVAVVNGNTLTEASVTTYSYASGVSTWHWAGTAATAGLGFAVGTPSTVTVTLGGGWTSGVILPKYKVVGLTYAPPGSKSTATYSNGFLSGNSTSNSSSFINSLTVTSKLSTGIDLFGFLGGTVTNTASTDWTQEQDSNSSLNLQQQYTDGLQVPGPPLVGTADQGVDHDYDTVYVWLNPADYLEFSAKEVVAGGEYYDQRDGETPETCNGHTYAGITGMDVVPLTIGQLRGAQPITDECLLVRLSRPWDTALGGLVSTDFLAIALTDPFYADPSFNPNTDTSGRFQVPADTTSFPFVPGSATHTYSSASTSTSAKGETAKTTNTVSFTVAGKASAAFLASVANNFSVSNKITYANQSSSTVTTGTSQTISYSVVPPAIGTYSGATEVQVWKDNIYGTFMFFPEN
jgi:hypothetical protein